MTSINLRERYTKVKRALFDKMLSRLNEEQRYAVYTVKGPLLVLAGAGSGKTTVLVKRIEYIIKYGNAYSTDFVPNSVTDETINRYEDLHKNGSLAEIEAVLPEFAYDACPPWRVLAITFTNKAANEMRERLAKTLDNEEEASQIWAGTFHKICLRILRRHAEHIGLSSNCTIYDPDDQKRTVKAVLEKLNLDDKQYPPKALVGYISRMKEKLLTPEDVMNEAGNDFKAKTYAKIYLNYQNALSTCNALDFDDIIMKTVQLLDAKEEIRAYYQNRFKYVLVDEYQDTNHAQFRLTELLSGGFRNLMVVGDDDQSIYKFRGATIENILSFDRSYPDATVIKLEQNYRSTQNILNAANAVIKQNKGRKGKELWTDAGEGKKIALIKATDQDTEARCVAKIISDKVASGEYKFRDFAILYRANSQSRSFENILLRSGIPYKIVGNLRFNEREEIKDMMSYFQLVDNPKDNERLKRIINKPRRAIGDKTVELVEAIASETGVSMYEVIENGYCYPVLTKVMTKLSAFRNIIEDLRKKKDGLPLNEFFEYAIKCTGYMDELISRGEEGKDKIDNLKELVSNAVEYMNHADDPSLSGFLEETMLVNDIDSYSEDSDSAIMMTIHAAKGLEFPVVFLPGMEENLFPSERTIYADEPDEEMEEERRLAYVAITRAKKELYIIHTESRLYFGRTTCNKLSRFARDIPPELIEHRRYPQPQRSNTPERRSYVSGGVPVERSSRANSISINNTPKVQASVSAVQISAGDRVRHRVFGDGTVISSTKMANDCLLEIIFDNVGTKKLMGNYAKLEKL